MQIRFRFSRGEELKFIGHLDILRLFERAFKRSELLVTHSGGFNPRPRIVFAQPMPLGLTSEGEFADVELAEQIDIAEFKKRINASLPAGIRIMDAKMKTGKSKLMGIIDAARYTIWFKVSEMPDINNAINSVYDSDKINVMKRTKRGEKEVDIRPFIYELFGENNGRSGSFTVLLGAGQDNNIRPELFLEGVSQTSNSIFEMCRMHRIMLYCRKKKMAAVSPEVKNLWVTPLDDLFL